MKDLLRIRYRTSKRLGSWGAVYSFSCGGSSPTCFPTTVPMALGGVCACQWGMSVLEGAAVVLLAWCTSECV